MVCIMPMLSAHVRAQPASYVYVCVGKDRRQHMCQLHNIIIIQSKAIAVYLLLELIFELKLGHSHFLQV